MSTKEKVPQKIRAIIILIKESFQFAPHFYIKIIGLMSIPLFIFACGGGTESIDSSQSGRGSISFRVVWQGGPNESDNIYARALPEDCPGVSTVEASIITENLENYSGGPWLCLAHQGIIYDVPAGRNMGLVLIARNTYFDIVYYGEKTGIEVIADTTNDAGDIIAEYTMPELSFPENGETVSNTNVELQWSSVPSATEYYVVIADDSDFNNIILDETTFNNSYSPTSLSASTTYYWYVVARYSEEEYGLETDAWSFTTGVESLWFIDIDGDLFGNSNNYTLSDTQPVGYVSNSTDCNDNDENINPDAIEICNDTVDNDCDNATDCADSDCTGDAACQTCTDSDSDEYHAESGCGSAVDCNDGDGNINPGATEVCDDGVDNDCDNATDCADSDCTGDAACLPTSDYSFDYAFLQYRTYEDASHSYRGWVDFTKLGDLIVVTDITQIVLKNMVGSLVNLSDTLFYSTLQYNGAWNDLTSSVDFSGPTPYSGFSIGFPEGTSLTPGTYTYEATTVQGDLLTYPLYFPGEISLPTVDGASMDYKWQSDDSLYLEWTAPTGDFDQLRIVIVDQDWQDVLYVKLPVDANDLTIPKDWIQNIENTYNPSSLNWTVQTRSYTTTSDENNYARGYANFGMMPWTQLGVSEICDNLLDDDSDGDTDCDDLECTDDMACTIPSDMALIPSGCFDMGDAFMEGTDSELPVHNVCITSDFYMDVHEVTNAEYAACVSAGECTAPSSSSSDSRSSYYGEPFFDDFPVIYVNWHQATDYCTWMGKRLPTEAEWEYAARGGLLGKRYPWGDTISGTDGNYLNSGDPWDNDTSPVKYYAANGYGLYDMSGNVKEYVNDWHEYYYYGVSPTNDPTGPASGTNRATRGGPWNGGTQFMRIAGRSAITPTNGYFNIGIRCASD